MYKMMDGLGIIAHHERPLLVLLGPKRLGQPSHQCLVGGCFAVTASIEYGLFCPNGQLQHLTNSVFRIFHLSVESGCGAAAGALVIVLALLALLLAFTGMFLNQFIYFLHSVPVH